MRHLRIAALLAGLLLPAAALAQNADILTGRITGTDGAPVVGARVTAMSIESEITRSVLSDKNGRYMINFPDGGGRYVLRVQMLGMADFLKTVIREDEELLLTNIVMQPQAISIAALEVTATRPPPGQARSGEQSTELSQELLNRLPLPDLDPNTLALLSAGVVGTSADSLSGRMGFSVAGMSDLLNQIVLDGVILGEGGLAVPEEGMRQTRVTTSTFDASRGGFAGGQVSMTTARGNNRMAGSLSYQFDDDNMQFNATPLTNAFTRHNIGGSVGGPLVRNKLFFNTSFQLTRNVNHRFALAANDPLAAQRSGVAVDSIARFLNILGNDYGFPTSGTGAYNQFNDDVRLQGRVDWNLLQRQGQSQTLSARFTTSLNNQDSTRISTVDLAQHGGESERNNWQGAVTLNSRFSNNWTNALSFSFSENWNETLPYLELPEGRVRVTSDFEDGSRQTSTLVFGGNRSMPTEAYGKDMQLTNDLSFLLPIGVQLHRLKVGASLQKTRNIDRSTDNLFGSFTFNSLEDFQANRPDRYERALTERQSRTGVLNAGVYFGDTWRISQPLEVTLGLRWDRSELDQRPAYNPAIEQTFGRRTDISPIASAFSPRLGFNYRLNPGQQGVPAKSLTGGIGLFAGRAPTNIFSTAVRQTGLPGAEERLICIGSAVPIPDWDAYAADPTVSPDECLDGTNSSTLSSRAPTVTLIDPEQSMPASLRLDLGYRAGLPFRLNGNVRYTYSRGLGLWGYRDLNLDENNTFILAGEDRPFFGNPDAIVAATGATSLAGSRRYTQYGNVYDVVSNRESTAHQLSMSVNGLLPKQIMMNLNYTLGFARDQGSGSFSQATTDGNPNEVEWATSSNDRRHTMNLTFAIPVKPEVELSVTTRLSSGAPYTPLVNRDINGDGARNDRAFVFDPANAPPEIANGMTRLLDVVPDRVRSCLEEQIGGIADRNSCRNSWSQSLDMRLSLRPNLPTFQRRLTISLDGSNVLSGLDQLINGRDDMKGWGESRNADNNLLEVRGFDRTNSRFIYEVNEGFGQTRRGPNAFARAFSLRLSARLAIGGQPFQSNRGFGAIAGAFGGGFGGPGGGGPGGGPGGEFGGGGPGGGGNNPLGEVMQLLRGANAANMTTDSLLARAIVNPIPQIIALKDSIGITAEQLQTVTAIHDELSKQLNVRKQALAKAAAGIDLRALMPQPGQGGGQGGRGQGGGGQEGPRANMSPELMQRLQLEIAPQLSQAQTEITQALRSVETAIGATAWGKLPPRIRNIGQRAAGGPGRGGFNATGLIDRMLANPIPVLLSLKDTLKLTPEQVTQIQAISSKVDESLTKRREDLGKRFDNVQGQEQGRVFQEVQPQIEAARKEVTTALQQIEKIIGKEAWQKVPERIRNPFANQQMPGQGRRGF